MSVVYCLNREDKFTYNGMTSRKNPIAPCGATHSKQFKDGEHLPPIRRELDKKVIAEMLKMGIDGKDQVEHFLLSNNPEERIYARRTKMQRRLNMSSDPSERENRLPIPTATDNQMIDSSMKIGELLEDSQSSILNVRSAVIQNEKTRQQIESQRRNEVENLIMEESDSARVKFEEINSKWEIISKKKDPLDIHEGTERQRDDCVALLEQKDMLIENLKNRLEQADQEFCNELTKQNDYINILVDRINDQINLMSECYRQEVQSLQNVINSEKDEILGQRVGEWAEIAELKEHLEIENIYKRYNYIQQCEEQIDLMLVRQHELMRNQKMKMEDKLKTLILEENKFQSAVLISTELLNYNVQVLQKRQDESRILKGKQKRTLIKLQETVHRQRQEQNDEYCKLCWEKLQLTAEAKRLNTNIKEVKDRIKLLADSSDKKYFQLWEYNQEVAQELINETTIEDRKFHSALMLGPWMPPKVEFSKMKIPSFQPQAAFGRGKATTKRCLWNDINSTNEIQTLSRLVVDCVLERNAHLVDDTLKVFLEPFSTQCNAIITINNIFETLGMKNKADIKCLISYLRPFVICRQCEQDKTGKSTLGGKGDSVDTNAKSIETVSRRLSRQLAIMRQVSQELLIEESDVLMSSEVDLNILRDENDFENVDSQKAKLDSERIKCGDDATVVMCNKPGHRLSINVFNVARVLKKFATKLHNEGELKPLSSDDENIEMELNSSRVLTSGDVETYWKRIGNAFSKEKILLWNTLCKQIKEYYKLLMRRNYLQKETKIWERRNLELRRLLMRYIQPRHAINRSVMAVDFE